MRHLIAVAAALLLITPQLPADDPLSAFMAAHKVPGVAVALLEAGQVRQSVVQGVRGPAGEPVTPQTQFIMGPGVSLFTEQAARQLIAAGTITPSQPVTAYVPCFQGGLTVGEALQRMPSHDLRLITVEDQRPEALQEAVCTGPAPPSLIVGAVIAGAYGTSYEQALHALVFEPYGLAGSFARPDRSVAYQRPPRIPQMAVGYREGRPAPELLTARVMAPAGMTITTVEDLARLVTAVGGPIQQVGYAPHFSSVILTDDSGSGVVILANAGVAPAAMMQLASDLTTLEAPPAPGAVRMPLWLPLASLLWATASSVIAFRWRGWRAVALLPIDAALAAGLVAGGAALSGHPLDVTLLYHPLGTGLLIGAVLFTLAFGFGRTAFMLTSHNGA